MSSPARLLMTFEVTPTSHLLADYKARVGRAQVVLPDMEALRSRNRRHVGAVVHNEEGAGLGRLGDRGVGQVEEYPALPRLGSQLDQPDAGREKRANDVDRRPRCSRAEFDVDDRVEPSESRQTRRAWWPWAWRQSAP